MNLFNKGGGIVEGFFKVEPTACLSSIRKDDQVLFFGLALLKLKSCPGNGAKVV